MRKLNESSPELPSAEEAGLEFANSIAFTGTDAAALKALRALPIEKIGDFSVLALMTKPKTYAGGPMFELLSSIFRQRRSVAVKRPEFRSSLGPVEETR